MPKGPSSTGGVRRYTTKDWKRLSQLYELIMYGTEPTDRTLRELLTLPSTGRHSVSIEMDHLQAENKSLRHEIQRLRAQLKKMPSPNESDSFA